MIDIQALRADKGGDPEAVRASEKRRGRSGSIVDKVIALDNEWVNLQFEVDQTNKSANAVAKEFGEKKKAGAAAAQLEEISVRAAEYKKLLPELKNKCQAVLNQRDALLAKIGNIVHDSVPVSNDEAQNGVLRKWGEIPKLDNFKSHFEILQALDGVEMKRAAEVAGHRGYYLKHYGAMLNQALVQYGQSFLRKHGYKTVQTPFFMKREFMSKAAELADFSEMLYCIPNTNANESADASSQGGANDPDDLFLIATSEQPLCCLHANEYLEAQELPLKYAGLSTCFRKEAGSHGKDMKGIFRVHQFEKVEQFVICLPSESWKIQEQMTDVSEKFYQSLNLPYRVVAIVTGALNDAAARKFDLEAWFPSYDDYRELVSCSNCTDYQSRSLNIRLGHPKMGEREKSYVHMLNGTLCATERTMCCVLEHWQTPDGVKVPPPLQPYMDGLEFLPFVAKADSA